MRFRPLLFVSFALMGIAGARADVTSTFDTGAEGWTTLRIDTTNGLSPLDAAPFPAANWSAGKLRNDEVSGGLFTLSAPDTYLGDKSAYYQGKVTYDFSDATSDRYPFGNLGFFLVKKDRSVALGYLQNLAPGVETSFSVPLQDDGRWYRYDGTAVPAKATNADLQSVLSDLGYLGINADWTTGTTDVTTLDNVAMTQPVPEPATLAALAAGSLALLRRRRR